MTLYECSYDVDSFRGRAQQLLLELAAGFDRYVRRHANREEVARALLSQALGICWRRLLVEIFRLKDPGFREEAEWRFVALPKAGREEDLVRFRSTSRGITPYLPIPLAEEGQTLPLGQVTVGPGDNGNLAGRAAEMLLRVRRYSVDGLVVPSKIPYRNVR